MIGSLQEICDVFASVEPETRLELLLDYAERLPPLPARYISERDQGLHRVPECMTPVFMWIEPSEGGRVRIYIDVAPEAPTVRGVLSIVQSACDNQTPDAIASLPDDLLDRLGLAEVIRMNRAVGIGAIIRRIRNEAAAVCR